MTEVSESMTVGARLRSSEAVETAVRSIVDEVGRLSAELTDIKPPSAELSESYDHYMKRAAETRGRALLYPYLGSGIGNGALVELLDDLVQRLLAEVGDGEQVVFGLGQQFADRVDLGPLEAVARPLGQLEVVDRQVEVRRAGADLGDNGRQGRRSNPVAKTGD